MEFYIIRTTYRNGFKFKVIPLNSDTLNAYCIDLDNTKCSNEDNLIYLLK